MKGILIVSCFLFYTITFAEFKSATEAETKLKTFSSKSFELKDQSAVEKAEDDLVDSLSDAVEFAEKAPKNDELNNEIVRVALVLLKQDKTNYGAEIIIPVYKKFETEFKTIIKNLPKPDSRLLEESIKSAIREADQGNG
ncbi:hypothetical protein D3C87_1732880 [compost metagenome]